MSSDYQKLLKELANGHALATGALTNLQAAGGTFSDLEKLKNAKKKGQTIWNIFSSKCGQDGEIFKIYIRNEL
jgi:hypothetical protein